ncbi:hypothetical protein BST50_05350 [Vibrio vulnificus]|uniref:hypothetical protein n=2 Tax=Vibrio vulnificus TaxID=672 RepID=UPI000BA8703C|nr:hypothetical protein [Vibrio vulnificus]ELE1962718.1 hypothetical protein [Vibrio vulnificus]ELV8702211.1 hypothetical protein [Vibrio vulnificus]PAO35465.1 hypothetical protein BST49_03580 [Vibrio vulnificus]PAO42033.1 hypothetical protein BST50_05350 [Vibrio vulnificus]PAO46797.1 hypothetical protein BST53_07780 [Vibrio vulnificus]
MSIPEIIGLVASLVSLIIGFYAVWLSVTFYKLSTKNTQDLEKASSDINSTVNRLEVLFDKLYSDTFGIMKDTVSDMRKYVWSGHDNLERSPGSFDVRLHELKSDINKSIDELKRSQGQSDKQFDTLVAKIETLVTEKINDTVNKHTTSWEQKESIVIEALRKHHTLSTRALRAMVETGEHESADLLFIMNHSGQITWDGDRNQFSDDTMVRLSNKLL